MRAAVGLAHAVDPGVLPVPLAELAVALSRIEEDLLAANRDYRDLVIQLVPVKICGLEDILIAVHHDHRERLQAGGANHGNEQPGNLARRSPLLVPDIFRVLHFEAFGLVLLRRMGTREARVLHLHRLGINLRHLLFV